jgi:molybdate transport system regulatory protein
MAKLSLRIDLSPDGALGPGKIRLLELIDETGSISAAGRAMDMSYRRAWLLLDELNHLFAEPVASTVLGGKAGGGASLTPLGKRIVRHYRDMVIEAHVALKKHLGAIDAALPRSASQGTRARKTA